MPGTNTIEHSIAGLEQPAEIVVDRWGIPHIRARTRHDVFFVQGCNAARDRLWQLDLWRKRGLGLMAADFGPGFLAQDRAARLFLYRGDMDAEWAAYGTPEARSITEAFVAGVNAWITLTEQKPELLPPEFAAMSTRPQRWTAEDALRIRSHGLVRNVLSEVARAQVVARAGLETDLVRRSLEPAWTPKVPEGLDPADIPANVLDVFKLATVRIDFSPERLKATLDEAWRWTKVDDLGDVYTQGSNNWAVSGSRTASGRPILASDPHRAHALPSLRSIVHLTGPGIDVIGAGEPAQPGISFGHNGRAAFGLTIFPMDQEDLYVYETSPNDPEQYRYGSGWERMRVVRETIPVKDAPDQEVVLKFTRHGPVVYEDAAKHRAFALRSVWFEPGSSAYFTSIACLDVGSPADYAKALRGWSTPSVNHVYADRDGNIAWYAVGRSPIRPNWDGLLPVPGDGRYEWAGFYPFDELPSTVNPARGFVATANEMNMPADYAYRDRKLGFEWAEWSRTRRIHEVLDGQPKHTVQQSMQLQTDDLSIPARRLGAVIADMQATGDAAVGLDLLRGWDFHLSRNSAAAALSEVWWSKHLKPAMLDLLAPDPGLRALLVPGDTETLLGILEKPDHRLPDRDALLAKTLAAAVADCRTRLGPDPAAWAWGKLHHGYFEHVLSTVAPGMVDVGPLPKGGSSQTPMNAGYRMSDFRITSGASFRMVIDVGNWDNSRAINAPGQSGDPRSPHYADLAPLWAAGEYVPLLYSQAAIDDVARLRIVLKP
jgi:penicillin amidase